MQLTGHGCLDMGYNLHNLCNLLYNLPFPFLVHER